jgi:hypothetical protein
MNTIKFYTFRIGILLLVLLFTGCTALSVIDVVASTAIDVTVGVVEVAGEAVGAVVDAVIPDDDD